MYSLIAMSNLSQVMQLIVLTFTSFEWSNCTSCNDGKQQPDVVVPDDGLLQLNVSGSNIKIGLPFTSKIQSSSVNANARWNLQGRIATVSRAVLRVYKSFGGRLVVHLTEWMILHYHQMNYLQVISLLFYLK